MQNIFIFNAQDYKLFNNENKHGPGFLKKKKIRKHFLEIRPGIKPKLFCDTASYPFNLLWGWLLLEELWDYARFPLSPREVKRQVHG